MIVNPARIGARRGWSGGHGSMRSGPAGLPPFPAPRSRFWARMPLSSQPRSGSAARGVFFSYHDCGICWRLSWG
eukprot:1141736-Pyramimonas_sp.AAC.1